MDKDENEKWSMLEEEMKKLPEKAQQAIGWIIENFDDAIEMCKETNMTDTEIEKHWKKASEEEDYFLLALLCVAKFYKNRDPVIMEK